MSPNPGADVGGAPNRELEAVAVLAERGRCLACGAKEHLDASTSRIRSVRSVRACVQVRARVRALVRVGLRVCVCVCFCAGARCRMLPVTGRPSFESSSSRPSCANTCDAARRRDATNHYIIIQWRRCLGWDDDAAHKHNDMIPARRRGDATTRRGGPGLCEEAHDAESHRCLIIGSGAAARTQGTGPTARACIGGCRCLRGRASAREPVSGV